MHGLAASSSPIRITDASSYQASRGDRSLWSNRPRTAAGSRARSWVCLLGLSLLSTATLTGCLRPYSKSVFDPAAAQFPGITSQWHGGTLLTIDAIVLI